MKALFLITFLSISCMSLAQNDVDCAKYKNGKFKIETENAPTSIITRQGKWQYEEVEEIGLKIKIKIKWIDECTYEMRVKKVLQNDVDYPIDTKSVIRTEIVAGTETSYTQRSTVVGQEVVVQSEMIIID